MRTLWLTATVLFCTAAQAQDLSLLAGGLKVNGLDERTFAGALHFAHPVGDHAALGLTYLNEGHPDNHHRDGVAGQVWLRSERPQRGWQVGVGLGPYYYFDTATIDGGYRNDHGWAPMYSVSANWNFGNRWFAQVQANRIVPRGKGGSTSILVGAGFHFDGVPGSKLHLNGPSSDDTITVSLGQTIINSLDSERARAYSLEYRRAISPYVDWSVSWINEGNEAATRRNGLTSQLWLIRSLSDNIELGMGAGPYVASELHDTGGPQSNLSGLLSIVGRYHLDRRWVAQLSWNRVVTDYHRDADLFFLGIGSTF
ncbi:MAG: hypothetical protein V4754_19615 [Pseudomonadota bacterium]